MRWIVLICLIFGVALNAFPTLCSKFRVVLVGYVGRWMMRNYCGCSKGIESESQRRVVRRSGLDVCIFAVEKKAVRSEKRI